MRLPYHFEAPLLTERLMLRTMRLSDVDDIHAYQSRDDVCAYLMFEARSREEVVANVTRQAEAVTLSGDGDYWQLAIERLGDPDRVIGDVYFSLKSVGNATAQIGWTLHPDCHGQGYMTEAAGAVLGLAFGELGLHRVVADLDARNEASAALCERLGMRREAHFAEDLWFRGAWGDTLLYGILEREWPATGAPPRSPPRG